ncbi:hypothetical protein SODALDRAFT_328110 [Sodiomyces alkalinus F11]|uniref:DRBM domain-containing protein n=1 Tax=Sodiomyces alkalinus (strain CBS 110278 / VKM F-3762 / F11) TaxID=1314773 RepID=A0A3N2PMH3_SODAK|nr:hypothetical protein SODALDRAFT_328110 [Sodiomyces alkalinus F11]ROT35725.1 hypothetical protein SODALDRAFT_328110 [Sodiomyces alkalinus F11]
MAVRSEQVDWARLKAYIAAKEAYEQQHGYPAPLSESEQEAIKILIPPPRPRIEDAVSDKTNWLGLLNHYAQTKYVSTAGLEFTYGSVHLPKAKGFDVAWSCLCTVPDIEGSFPSPGYGMESDETEAPVFMKKQDAKQHAAKWACDYLIKNNLMPSSGSLSPPSLLSPATTPSKRPASPPSLRTPSPNPSTAQANATQSLALGKKRHATPVNIASSSSSSSSSNGGATSTAGASPPNCREEDQSTAVAEVAALAKALRLPVPRYQFVGVLEKADFWSVRVDFHDSPMFPIDLGSVDEVYTKKAAKEKSAELIKDWMESMRFRKDQTVREMLQRGKTRREVEVGVN